MNARCLLLLRTYLQLDQEICIVLGCHLMFGLQLFQLIPKVGDAKELEVQLFQAALVGLCTQGIA